LPTSATLSGIIGNNGGEIGGSRIKAKPSAGKEPSASLAVGMIGELAGAPRRRKFELSL
jgi:hypothetical protein